MEEWNSCIKPTSRNNLEKIGLYNENKIEIDVFDLREFIHVLAER